MGINHNRIIIKGFVLAASFLFGCGVSNLDGNQAMMRTEDLVWASLIRYEGYVQTLEDPSYGYVFDTGYPMYLATFSHLYLSLYQHTGNSYYLQKAVRAIGFIEKIRLPNNTWNTWNGWPHPIYNGLFLREYMEAYEATGDVQYLVRAKPCVDGMTVFFDGQSVMRTSPNVNILTAAACMEYCWRTRSTLGGKIGVACYWYARLNGFYLEDGTWYYNTTTRDAQTFNGHDANYAVEMTAWLLSVLPAIQVVSPSIAYDVRRISPKVLNRCELFVQSDGTFPYSSDAPHSLETAGGTVLAWALGDNLFGGNHSALIQTALNTILSNQAPSGAFYKNAGDPAVIQTWYGDDLAYFLPEYLDGIIYLTNQKDS